MTNIVKINETPELKALEQSKAEQIRTTFEPMVKMLSDFEKQYNEVISESEKEITRDVTLKAKRVRIDIGRVRIETAKLKDKQKEYIKLEDRAIMGVHNIIVWAVKEKEDKLKDIENYFEIQEKKRLEELQRNRAELLHEYVEDAHERNLSSMEEDVWTAYFSTKKKEYEDRIAAEKLAELDRIEREKAEAEERERIRIENERLKAEAEAQRKKAEAEAAERAKAEKERIEKETADRKEREEKERKEREAHETALRKEREERERIEKEERAKREILEAELRAKAEAEAKAKAEAEAAKQAELNKGDSEKVADLIKSLSDLKSKYVFKAAKNKKMYADVGVLIDKVINHINKK